MAINLPPQAGAARDAAILARVGSKDYDPIVWVELTSRTADGAHEASFYAFADALKLDGVRVDVSARVAQQIADVLGCVLLTARLADLLYLARTASLLPSPQAIASTTVAMGEHSARVDAQLAALDLPPSPARGSVYQTVGKHWILDNDTLSHPGRACNYGWHFLGTFAGSAWEAAVSGGGLRVVQGRGWAHDVDHVDYSQTCVLLSQTCTVDGQQRDVRDVLASAELAPLASAQGPLRIVRQPGVAPYAAPPDVWIPVSPPSLSRCPDLGLAPLANVVPWTGAPPATLQAWASAMLRYPLGTVIRDTVGGAPIVARIECHYGYGAHPEQPGTWHKGVSVYRPATLDASSGKLVPVTSPPAGWPGSSGVA
jgi:hypothetical protein